MILPLLALALLALCAPAQNVSYAAAALDGAQVVPPVATAARGWATVRLDAATNAVRIFLYHEALSGPPTAADLHQGALALAGGSAVVTLTAAGGNVSTGVATLSPAQAAALLAGGTYLDVHTAANPNGEIRGQVVAASTSRFTGRLTGSQEVPPNASAATGTVTAFLHEPGNRLVYVVDSTGLANVTAAHIHQGAAGVSGPIVTPLNGSNGSYCGVTDRLTAAQRSALLANGLYVNIHTAAFPNGEIRAQLTADQGDLFRAGLAGANEVPPNASSGFGSVRLERTANNTIAVAGEFANLSAPVTAAHVHAGAPGVIGGIVFPLTISGNRLSGTFAPSATNLNDLRAGNWYVNVHSTAFPNGEIRGQFGPAALATAFGEGCPGSNGARAEIAAGNTAVLASTVDLDLHGGAAGALAVLALGADRDSSGPLALPVELPVVGLAAPRCFALVQPAATAVVFTDATGCASFPLPVPLAPGLRGAAFYAQWFVFDAAANPGGIVTSSALALALQ